MKVKIFNQNPYGTNTYIISCEKSGLGAIIDPTGSVDEIERYINSNNINIKYILLTHCHFDHIQLLKDIKNLTQGIICIHKEDGDSLKDENINLSIMFGQPISIEADKELVDGEELPLGKYKIKVFHTPGHTGGSCIFLVEDYLFSGDTLFKGSIGRTDLPTGSYETIIKSLDIFKEIDLGIKVFPGHGDETNIHEELKNNPYLRS